MEGYGSGNGLWGEAFRQYISSDGKQLPAEIKKKVFTKMSEHEFKDWLRKHGVSDPNLNIGISAWALPILMDYAVNESIISAQSEAYAIADRISEDLVKAYKQGINDAWESVKALWNDGTFSVEWSADEMMRLAENQSKHAEEVKKLADEMGISALYTLVSFMRGEK